MLNNERLMIESREKLLAHPMCFKLVEESARIIVFFPPGYQVDAAQVCFKREGVGKAKAFELLLNTCEKYWSLV